MEFIVVICFAGAAHSRRHIAHFDGSKRRRVTRSASKCASSGGG
jgi:hypothetical protein